MPSQNERILSYLRKGYSLTGLQALKLVGTMKLASRVSELRQQGYDIQGEMIKRNGKWIKKYYLV